MAAISNLLRSTQYIPLLPHQSVQIPLSTLITSVQDIKKRRDIQNNHVSTFDEEFLALLETICLKIQEIPSCIHFFYTEQLQKEGRFPLFDCLIIHLHQNDTSGERSRQATQRLLDVAAKDYDDSFTKYILATNFSEIVVCCECIYTFDGYLYFFIRFIVQFPLIQQFVIHTKIKMKLLQHI